MGLDNKEATTTGTTVLYVNDGIYLDGENTKKMTPTENPITIPTKTGYTFNGYYTEENGQGAQVINANGYSVDEETE